MKNNSVLRYTVLRLLIFFGCLLVLWLVGLRGPDQQILLLLLAALSSVVLSYFLLRRERDDFSQRISDRLERRAEARATAVGEDEAAEDAEIGTADTSDPPRDA